MICILLSTTKVCIICILLTTRRVHVYYYKKYAEYYAYYTYSSTTRKVLSSYAYSSFRGVRSLYLLLARAAFIL